MTQSKQHQESFVRWQSTTIAQLGYSIGLLLSIATAMLGFAFALLKDRDFSLSSCEKYVFVGALLLLTASVALGLACVVNRLCDFRLTTGIARGREQLLRDEKPQETIDSFLKPKRDLAKILGKRTWSLFWWQTGTFSLGVLFLILALATLYHAKLL